MLTETTGSYLQTGSNRVLYKITSGNISGCLTIVPYSGLLPYPEMSLNEAKFSFIVLSGGVHITLIDNDHPIEVSGSQFVGLHQHRFMSGNTVERIPIRNLKNIGEAGSFAQALWENVFLSSPLPSIF